MSVMGPVELQRKSSAKTLGRVALTSTPFQVKSGGWTHLIGGVGFGGGQHDVCDGVISALTRLPVNKINNIVTKAILVLLEIPISFLLFSKVRTLKPNPISTQHCVL